MNYGAFNHLDQTLSVLNLNIIIEWSFSCLSFFFGRGLDGTAEKIDVKMEQLKKIIRAKIMYINKNR